MKTHSAGLIVYRFREGTLEVLLAHMGGPWFANKDAGAWSIPKGIIEAGEEPLAAAKREFGEELGLMVPESEYIKLADVVQHNNKTITAWAVQADLDVSAIKSNTFEAEWPPRSGQLQRFAEMDRAGWFSLLLASEKCVQGQEGLFKQLSNLPGIFPGSGAVPGLADRPDCSRRS